MRRRDFVALLGGAGALRVQAAVGQVAGQRTDSYAKSKPTVRLGTASFGARGDRVDGYAALFERLAELGYIEGRNLEVDFMENVTPEQLTNAFPRAVQRGASMLFTSGHDIGLLAAQVASAGRIPIVFVAMDYDPVRLGYVQSIPCLLYTSPSPRD